MTGFSLAERFQLLPPAAQAKVLRALDLETVAHSWLIHGRPGQIEPAGEWRTWLMMAGRGYGKTRAGAEWVRRRARSGGEVRIAIVGATIAEARRVMVEGESGILATGSVRERPVWEPSRGRLYWPWGAQAFVYSGENPEGLRGPQHHFAWCDELAKWAYPGATWDNLQFGLRHGAAPRAMVTTTPRPIPLLKRLATEARVTGGTTFENRMLPARFVAAVQDAYGGTLLGRQELDGVLIDEPRGSLWPRALIERSRARSTPGFERVVVGVEGEEAMDAFDDVRFPIAIGREASVEPAFATAIVTSAGGTEQRNSEWADARLRFDAGPGVRGEAEMEMLIAFFRARRGAAVGFRFEDPFDHSSNAMTGAPGAADQAIGTGDGERTEFALVKLYGTQERKITRPVESSVRVSVSGVEQVVGWTISEKGVVRFPSLTFEVDADEGPVAMGAIAAELSAGTVGAGETPLLGGYAGTGDSVRAAIEGMSEVAPLALAETEDGLVLTILSGDPILIETAATGAAAPGAEDGRTEVARIAADAVAAEISIAYHDVDRDYQTGLQRAGLAAGTQRIERRAIPAALTADGAKALAEAKLKAMRAARSSATLRSSWRLAAIPPGTLARIEGQSGVWEIERWTLERMVAKFELVRVAERVGAAIVEASPGRPIGHADLLHGPTSLRLMDLPLPSELSSDRPEILVAAAGVEPGWRRAALAASFDDGASWVAAGGTAAVAVIGEAVTILAPGGSALVDGHNVVEVELLTDSMWLEGRDADALVGGANLALLGDELIQFERVEPIGPRRFRLSRLLRGRRGTEWAAATHQPGERFVLIEPEALTALPAPLSAIGADMRVSARGIGDALTVEATIAFAGESLRPPSPVHVRAARQANGDLAIDWVRRSRNGWAWIDGETPLVEAREAYRLRLTGPAGARVLDVAEPQFLYSAAEQASDGNAGAALSIEVSQLGTVAASRPAALTVFPD